MVQGGWRFGETAQEAAAGSLGRDKGLACSGCWGWREDIHVTWGGRRGGRCRGEAGGEDLVQSLVTQRG